MRRATFALGFHLPPPCCLNGFTTRVRMLLRNFISPETPRRQFLREKPPKPLHIQELCRWPSSIYMFGVGGQLLTLYSHRLEAGSTGTLYCFVCTKGSVQHRPKGKITKWTEVAKRCDVLNHSFSSRCGSRPWLAITTNLYSVPSLQCPFFFSPYMFAALIKWGPCELKREKWF